MEIIYTHRHASHSTDSIKPRNALYYTDEIPQRVERIRDALEVANLGPIQPPEDFGDEHILAVHAAEMVSHLRSAYKRLSDGTGQPDPVFPDVFPIHAVRRASLHPTALAGKFSHGTDSPILEGTWEAAYWSAQCALTGAKRLLNGKRAVYAVCRPPGHHAMADAYGGFCYLNNAAVAVRYLQNVGGLHKIAILDIDYHHGNGTQEIFYSDPSVLFCSLHANPEEDYPYFWGGADEAGDGLGEGYNCNWPLPRACSEEHYLQVLCEALDRIVSFGADSLLISLGLDIITDDPLGGFNISMTGIGQIGSAIASLNLPTLVVQEGGYRLDILGDAAVAFFENFVT